MLLGATLESVFKSRSKPRKSFSHDSSSSFCLPGSWSCGIGIKVLHDSQSLPDGVKQRVLWRSTEWIEARVCAARRSAIRYWHLRGPFNTDCEAIERRDHQPLPHGLLVRWGGWFDRFAFPVVALLFGIANQNKWCPVVRMRKPRLRVWGEGHA
jgi:hypothetical protein